MASSCGQDEQSHRGAVQDLLANYDAFLFDCDGTLYQAETSLPSVSEAVGYLRKLGKKVAYVTNTSARSAEQLHAKLSSMGVPCTVDECMPSGAFTAQYIKQKHPGTRRVYVIGGQGLVEEFQRVGIDADGLEDSHKTFEESEYRALGEAVSAVQYDGIVVGFDTSFNYYKLAKSALIFQRHPNCFFYSTNSDATDRIGQDLLPGNGCVVPAVEAVSRSCGPSRVNAKPPFAAEAVVLGKPSREFASAVTERMGVPISRVVMFGDRLDTDIQMAVDAGMGSCLVLTGIHGPTEVEAMGIRPTYLLPGVGSLWDFRPATTGAASL